MSDYAQQPLFAEVPEPDWPLVCVAAPLSGLDLAGRQTVSAWSELISAAVLNSARDASSPWQIRIHLVTKMSAPWKGDGRSGREVLELNSTVVKSEADALVIVGYKGGSIGVGQELEWALRQGMPVLYLHHVEDCPSRQVRGTSEFGDVLIEAFTEPEEIESIVLRFLHSRRPQIEEQKRRRRDRILLFGRLQSKLNERWETLASDERLEVMAVVRMKPARIEQLLASVHELACASVVETFDLTAALGLSALDALGTEAEPELEPSQLAALASAATEYEWDPITTLNLLAFPRMEVARGGIRRLLLSQNDDWLALYEAWKRP
jgi:hypothetical protein